MLESIQWFHAVVPQDVQPQNMDGEVAQFQCITPQQLQAMTGAEVADVAQDRAPA